MSAVTDEMIDIAFKATRFQMVYPSFRIDLAQKLANDIILREIHDRMKSKGFSQKIIDSTHVTVVNVDDHTGRITIRATSDYEAEKEDGTKFDVAKAREEGTTRHWVGPKKPGGVLAWPSAGPFSGRSRVAIFAKRFSNTAGKFLFSKGHYVSGIKEERIVRDTCRLLAPVLQREFDKESLKFFKEVMTETHS